jgi:hypothetical protein
VTDLDLSLITGGFTIAAVAVTFGGNALLDILHDHRARKRARDAAIADLLTASVELVLAVNAVRAAYQHRTGGRARVLIAAALLQDLPDLDTWKSLTDRTVTRTLLRTASGLAREQDVNARKIVLDYAGMAMPQISRFFAAVAAVTLGHDTDLADAARRLSAAGGELLENVGARNRKQARARTRFDKELGKFRAVTDQRRR